MFENFRTQTLAATTTCSPAVKILDLILNSISYDDFLILNRHSCLDLNFENKEIVSLIENLSDDQFSELVSRLDLLCENMGLLINIDRIFASPIRIEISISKLEFLEVV